MGVDRDAFIGLGIVIKAPPKVKGTRESCNHPEREGNEYCPKCGQRVTTHSAWVDSPASERFRELAEFVQEQDLPAVDATLLDAYGEGNQIFIGHYHTTEDIPSSEKISEILAVPYPDLFRDIEAALVDFPEFLEDAEIKPFFGVRYS
jgi:hypothetical protein